MAKQQRSTTRKARDKWKSKNWYKILAPEMFGENEMAETLSDDLQKLIGRSIYISLMDLTGDFSKQHIKLKFKIKSIRGDQALTVYSGHSLTSDYIRRLTRRKHSKMDGVYDVRTKDGYIVRIKPMAITEKRIQSSQERVLRKLTGDTISKRATLSTLSEFIKSVISGDLSKEIFRRCKPIYPIKRVEISKSEIRKRLEGYEDVPLMGAGSDEGPDDDTLAEPTEEEAVEVKEVAPLAAEEPKA